MARETATLRNPKIPMARMAPSLPVPRVLLPVNLPTKPHRGVGLMVRTGRAAVSLVIPRHRTRRERALCKMKAPSRRRRTQRADENQTVRIQKAVNKRPPVGSRVVNLGVSRVVNRETDNLVNRENGNRENPRPRLLPTATR
jgi:hypothetical protein